MDDTVGFTRRLEPEPARRWTRLVKIQIRCRARNAGRFETEENEGNEGQQIYDIQYTIYASVFS